MHTRSKHAFEYPDATAERSSQLRVGPDVRILRTS